MSDENQIEIPPSFVALYVPPGRIKPTEPRAVIAERYEFCDDLAQLMMETASNMLHGLGITEMDVIERCHRGLLTPESGVSEAEAGWVVRRLAELQGWDDPGPMGAEPSAAG
jgi:hypothetical protein